MKMNAVKTKVMLSGKNSGLVEKLGKWLCSICGKRVRNNTFKGCSGWVDKQCSGIKGSLARVGKSSVGLCEECFGTWQ